MIPVAVSTLVLAAMAVSAPADPFACPPGRAIDLERPVLPWMQSRSSDPLAAASFAKRPNVTLKTAIGDGAAVVRQLSRLELSCGRGRGDLVVRAGDHGVVVTALGFDARTSACLESALQRVRFTRVADGTMVRVAIVLP